MTGVRRCKGRTPAARIIRRERNGVACASYPSLVGTLRHQTGIDFLRRKAKTGDRIN